MEEGKKRGGARPNSGRPKLYKKKYLITSLPQNIELIRKIIKIIHLAKDEPIQ